MVDSLSSASYNMCSLSKSQHSAVDSLFDTSVSEILCKLSRVAVTYCDTLQFITWDKTNTV